MSSGWQTSQGTLTNDLEPVTWHSLPPAAWELLEPWEGGVGTDE